MSTTEPTSRRDYFAANAPADPPDWFKPDLDELLPIPSVPPVPADLEAYIKAQGGILCRDMDDLPDSTTPIKDLDVRRMLNQYREDVQEHQKQVNQVLQRRVERRYFAWRWHYAEQMIKTNPVSRVGVVL